MTVNRIHATNVSGDFSKTQKTMDLNYATESSGPPSIEWNKTYDIDWHDKLGWAIQTSDGGYAFAGTTDSGSWGAPRYTLLIKTDANGEVEWDKNYGYASEICTLIQTSDGGYALAGYLFWDSGSDALLIKTDSSGNQQWNKTYGKEKWDEATCLIQTKDGGYAMVTKSFSPDVSSYPWLIKTDANGEVEWDKSYSASGIYSLSLIQTKDGGYAMAGDVFLKQEMALLIKTDSSGNQQWNKTYGGGEEPDWVRCVIQTDEGYVLTGGTMSYTDFGSDFWLIKTDLYGNMLWNRTYGGDRAVCVIQTREGGYVMAGDSVDDYMLLVKTDSSGNEQWFKTFRRGSIGISTNNIIQTSDDGYMLAGTIYNDDVYVNLDFCLVKFAPESLEETEVNLKILDGNKWHSVQVPFEDVDNATSYIDNFENNGKPPLDFGTLPLNIEIQNVGNEAAEKLVCNCTITGVAIMIHLSDESIFKDNKTMYSFNYSTSKTIGTIYKGQSQNVTMNIPVEYMCVVAGPLTLDKGDEWVEPYTVDILFTIVELNVRVKISGSNCQPIEDQTRLYSVGNPYDLIDRMIDAAKQRVENAKEEALKRLLEMHIGVLATGVKTATFPAEVGQRRFIRTIDPGTTSLNVGVILSTGIKLTGLTVVIKEAISGLTSTLSITSSAVPGFAMICFTDVYKLLPKGKLSAEITLETKSEAMAAGAAQVSQQDSNATLVMTNIIPPEYFEFSWKGSDYHVGIATNSTISGFKFNETIATISFNATGIAGENYFFKVSIPSEVIGENFNIWCDDNPIYDFKLAQNTTHSFLYFEYNFTKENYEIIIIPEFSQFLFLLFFFGLTLLAVKIRKKHNQNR
jgi:uncharacterized membrane protein YjfL (UPF0719 family)